MGGWRVVLRCQLLPTRVYKPTLIEASPGAKQGTFHRDFSVDGGLSITFALTNEGMLWGDNGIYMAQPRRSGTVFDGNYCHIGFNGPFVRRA